MFLAHAVRFYWSLVSFLSFLSHSFQINSLLKMIPPHFLENYFAALNIKKLKTITNHFKRELFIWNEWYIFIFIDIYNN